MPPANLSAAIEALLFSSDQPLPLALVAESVETEPEACAAALTALAESYASRGAGVELREIAGGWQFVTAPEQAEWVGRMLRGKRKMRLSRAALETLAIIAYKQPVTKSEVESIRGVDSSGVMATLLERNLVTIRGRSKVVGRPLLYGTTVEFLEYFGLKDLTELPRPEELRALVAAREPEQLDMMEIEVVSEVATGLVASEAAGQLEPGTHEVEPLAETESLEDAVLADAGVSDLDEASDDDEDEDEDDEFEDDDDDEYDEDDDDEDDDDEDAEDAEAVPVPARREREPGDGGPA